ncbi:PAS domain-containing sensor histidine kinase [Roseococcus suduntuyensis]|uniref:PAS domain-containing sensor histidine kinase n=1 Tax=Roseococcus suduntuyensis TaxID=455361 RepID=UPI00160C7CA3|nr:PAS domain-containing sensor histidine kinase [Roseococcus suduntuyensis]
MSSFDQALAPHMARILDAIGQPLFATDREGWLTAYNPAAAEVWGCSPPLHATRWCGSDAVFAADGQLLAPAQYPVARALAEGRPIRGLDIVARRQDGARVPLSAHASPFHDAAGSLLGAVVLLLDTSAQRQAEARARVAAVAKTRFLSAMSHELRTPIHGIMGLTDLLAAVAAEEMPLGAEELGWIEDIRTAAQQLLGLVDDAIGFAQASVAAARPQPPRRTALLGKTVSDVASTVQPAFVRRGVCLTLQGAPGAAPAALDPAAARQALLGVLREVLRHMPDGGQVTLEWGVAAEEGIAFIHVACPGLTLPPDLLAELDNPFAGADRDSYARGLEGVGLSVAAAGELLRGHGGQLVIQRGHEGTPPGLRLTMPMAREAAPPPPNTSVAPAPLPPVLAQASFPLEQVVAATQDIILVTAADLDTPGPTIVYVNPAFTELTGYPAEEVLGRSPRLLQGPGTDHDVLRRVTEDLHAGRVASATVLNYTRDGAPYWVEMRIVPLRDRRGAISHFAAIERVVSQAALPA